MNDDLDTCFDFAVVGNGLLGSSVARSLSELGARTLVLGAGEPESDSGEEQVYSSHADEARITRVADADSVRALLAAEAIAMYEDIQERSGMTFFTPCGFLAIAEGSQSDWFDSLRNSAQNADVRLVAKSGEDIESDHSLRLRESSMALFEQDSAGYIHPRKLIEANNSLTTSLGGVLLREQVVTISHVSGHSRLITRENKTVRAKKIVLATGAFTESLGIIPPNVVVRNNTYVLGRIGPDAAASLKRLPSVIFRSSDPEGCFYLLPPVNYPDGNTYIKIGHSEVGQPIENYHDIFSWFQGIGSEQVAQRLKELLANFFLDIDFLELKSFPCVTTHTPSGYPYIDWWREDCALLLGGNGFCAKSCLGIGEIAAEFFANGKWNKTYPRSLFSLD